MLVEDLQIAFLLMCWADLLRWYRNRDFCILQVSVWRNILEICSTFYVTFCGTSFPCRIKRRGISRFYWQAIPDRENKALKSKDRIPVIRMVTKLIDRIRYPQTGMPTRERPMTSHWIPDRDSLDPTFASSVEVRPAGQGQCIYFIRSIIVVKETNWCIVFE